MTSDLFNEAVEPFLFESGDIVVDADGRLFVEGSSFSPFREDGKIVTVGRLRFSSRRNDIAGGTIYRFRVLGEFELLRCCIGRGELFWDVEEPLVLEADLYESN